MMYNFMRNRFLARKREDRFTIGGGRYSFLDGKKKSTMATKEGIHVSRNSQIGKEHRAGGGGQGKGSWTTQIGRTTRDNCTIV